ncbi:MAG TPA: hypothetical protein VKB78_14845, partial [Pirellulales bacterium]|nr:hypothetical protein [Pirellulales bacterium]
AAVIEAVVIDVAVVVGKLVIAAHPIAPQAMSHSPDAAAGSPILADLAAAVRARGPGLAAASGVKVSVAPVSAAPVSEAAPIGPASLARRATTVAIHDRPTVAMTVRGKKVAMKPLIMARDAAA